MAVSQLMTAKSSVLAADFIGANAPSPSYLGGDPVKIQASILSDYLTSSGSPLQKLQQVDISMAPSKIQSSLLATSPTEVAPTAPFEGVLQQNRLLGDNVLEQLMLLSPKSPDMWTTPKEAFDVPPGTWWFPPEIFASPEPWVNSWPENWISSWPVYQGMPEPPTPLGCINAAMAPLGPTSPPPGLGEECCTIPSAVECGGAKPFGESDLTMSSAESTELGGAAESASDDDWSSRASGSPVAKDAGSSKLIVDGTDLDGAQMGRLLLDLLNKEASDKPSDWDPDTLSIDDLLLIKIEEREGQESGADKWNEQTFGVDSEEDPLPPPPGLPLPPPGLTSLAHNIIEPPPGLIISEAQSNSGSDADISDAEAQCSPSIAHDDELRDMLERIDAACAAEACAISSLPEMQMVSPSSEKFSEPASEHTHRKGKKTRLQHVKTHTELISADQKKVAVPVSSSEQLISTSRHKVRVNAKQLRNRTQPSSSVPSTEQVVRAPTAIIDGKTGLDFSWGVWWIVLLVLGFAALFAIFSAHRQDSAQLDPSLAHEVTASAMVAPGASHVWASAAPASASAHLSSKRIASLVKSMDIEFARANAVASSMKSKMKEVNEVAKALRQQKKHNRKLRKQ